MVQRTGEVGGDWRLNASGWSNQISESREWLCDVPVNETGPDGRKEKQERCLNEDNQGDDSERDNQQEAGPKPREKPPD